MMQETSRELIPALRQATMTMRAAFRLALADLDLTPQQNTVLNLIAAQPDSSSAELARRTHVTAQTMHKIVSELHKRGLVTLHPRPGHGRILDAQLTDEGRLLLADADARGQTIEDRMTEGLDEQQRRQLIELLEHCTESLGSALETSTDPDI